MSSGFDFVPLQSPFCRSDSSILEFPEILERNIAAAEKALHLKALGNKGRRF
jgi:hypothetical protein